MKKIIYKHLWGTLEVCELVTATISRTTLATCSIATFHTILMELLYTWGFLPL